MKDREFVMWCVIGIAKILSLVLVWKYALLGGIDLATLGLITMMLTIHEFWTIRRIKEKEIGQNRKETKK